MTEQTPSAVGPLSKFHFSVQLSSDLTVVFQEAEGLDAEAQITDYRHGNSPIFYPIKMPGVAIGTSVTLRKGLVETGDIWIWYREATQGIGLPRSVVIRLLDETGKTTMTWTLGSARVDKVGTPVAEEEGGPISLDSVDLTYASLDLAMD